MSDQARVTLELTDELYMVYCQLLAWGLAAQRERERARKDALDVGDNGLVMSRSSQSMTSTERLAPVPV